jgi:hypothetical protein
MNNYAILTALISIVGYFLRDLHTRLKQAEKEIIYGNENIIKNNAKMEAIEGFQVTGFSHIEKLFDEKFKSISAELTHINNNVRTSHELFAIIIQDKKEKS